MIFGRTQGGRPPYSITRKLYDAHRLFQRLWCTLTISKGKMLFIVARSKSNSGECDNLVDSWEIQQWIIKPFLGWWLYQQWEWRVVCCKSISPWLSPQWDTYICKSKLQVIWHSIELSFKLIGYSMNYNINHLFQWNRKHLLLNYSWGEAYKICKLMYLDIPLKEDNFLDVGVHI
jgi:hypothetical protein